MPDIELLDGAMGSEFIKRGFSLPDYIWSADMNIKKPEIVQDIHKEYIDSGSSYLTTNTFRATARSYLKTGLNLIQSQKHAEESTLNAVNAAKNVSKNKTKILGAIAPLEDCYKPEDFPDISTAYKEFKDIGSTLSKSGVDIFLLETMNSIVETETCIEAIKDFNKPIWVSFILKDEKHLLSGDLFTKAIELLNKYNIQCMLINCTPLHRTMDVLPSIKENWSKRWGIYPNLGVGEPSPDGDIKSIHSNDNYIKLVYKAVQLGGTLFGGCCGSNPQHIAYLKSKMDKFEYYKQ